MHSPSDTRGDEFGQERSERLRVCDFMRRDGVVLDSPDDRVSMDDTLIAGRFLHRELRRGLFLHGGDAIEERAFTATSHVPEGLSCIFFLDGEVSVKIGDRRFEFKAGRYRAMNAMAVMNVIPESFQRASTGRQHVHHLVVSATPEWLDLEGLQEVGGGHLAPRLFAHHLANRHWTPTSRVVELVRQIFASSLLQPQLRNLYLESHAVEIVAETLAAVLRTERSDAGDGVLTRRDRIRLERAKEVIAVNLSESLSVEAIAREAGASTSGLQRLFRVSESSGVFAYVRRTRLERARDALQSGEMSVKEASVIAGYANPANFATAFKRQYGFSPRGAPYNILPGQLGGRT